MKRGNSNPWQNIIFLVLDACRSDYLEEYAPNLNELAEENLYFENAVAPSDWSLPSHASLFSGKLPHEHGQCSKEMPFESVPLIEALNDSGYTTYAVSANPFCNRAFNFDEPFDEFVSTMNRSLEKGLQIGDATVTSNPENSFELARQYGGVLFKALNHDAPLASLFNLAIAGKNKAVRNFEAISKIPHPALQKNLYTYSPEWNTNAITEFLEQESKTSNHFFIFSNYMDTHRPYYPSSQYQREVLGEKLPFREIKRLNEGIGHPQRFLELDNTDQIDERDLETLRLLYAGTVMEVDQHIQTIITTLEELGLREETLVVITADHGENLGEADPRGGRRMGHIESISDNHLTVPLIIANPSVNSEKKSEYVPLISLFDLMQDKGRHIDKVGTVFESDSPITNECPASKEDWLDDYPKLPIEIANSGTREHMCVSYQYEYKIGMSTSGDMWAWHGDVSIDINDCPRTLVDACSQDLEDLSSQVPLKKQSSSSRIDNQTSERLKDLGYL